MKILTPPTGRSTTVPSCSAFHNQWHYLPSAGASTPDSSRFCRGKSEVVDCIHVMLVDVLSRNKSKRYTRCHLRSRQEGLDASDTSGIFCTSREQEWSEFSRSKLSTIVTEAIYAESHAIT